MRWMLHALDDRHREIGQQAEEAERDEIDQRQQRGAQRPGLHHVRQQLDRDVRVARASPWRRR